MRTFLCALLAAGVFALGCKDGPFRRPEPRPVHAGVPTAEQVVTYLNQNARGVHSIQYGDVDISVKQGAQSFGADAYVFYQKPRNFRMQATSGGMSQADVGSNEQEFWFWIRQDKSNAVYRCLYEDLPRVNSLKIPLNPEWICEALCVQELGDPRQYQVRGVGGAVELTSQTTSPQGAPMQKIITVALGGPMAGRVTGLKLRSAHGQEIWAAEITEYHVNLPGQHAIPRKLKIRCPSENLEINFKLDKPEINTIQAQAARNLFQRPEIHGYQVIDLARGPAQTQSRQNIRGATP